MNREERIAGCLLGTAVGDALGLPYEGLPPRRAARMLGPPDRFRFFWGRGMVSDDTEHAWMTAQAFTAARGDVDGFRRDLARRLRWWLLGIPAGVGLATLRAIGRLWLGWAPEHSGVFSAGNGPLMRAAILGVLIEDDAQLAEFICASTRLTHSDPKAERAAFTIALATRMSCDSSAVDGGEFLDRLRAMHDDAEWLELVQRALAAADGGRSVEEFAVELGLARGVTGYAYHTGPIVLHAWRRYSRDYRAGVTAVIRCGGDTDTTAAILGGVLGAANGRGAIPAEWSQRLWTWPADERVLADLCAERPVVLRVSALLLRNALFACVVLVHGVRRLLPPWS